MKGNGAFEGDSGVEPLVQQASLDRLSNDRQLQYRFASHETLLHQFQLLEPLDDLFREAPVTDQPALADFFLSAVKGDRSQGILLGAGQASCCIDCSAMISGWNDIGYSFAPVRSSAPGQSLAGSSTAFSAGSGSR